MAAGDKTITFSEVQVNFLLQVMEEFRLSAEGQSSLTTEQMIQTVIMLFSNTPASS